MSKRFLSNLSVAIALSVLCTLAYPLTSVLIALRMSRIRKDSEGPKSA